MAKAVNWNTKEDEFSLMFWKQNIEQFWTEEEIAVSADKNTWNELSPAEQETYKKVLGGLTLLDTKQGGEGMPLIAVHLAALQAKSVLMFMGAMEEVHAKSYSHIFTTLASEKEIEEIFEWVDKHPLLTKKANLVTSYYRKLLKPDVSPYELYMAMTASVYLESFLFYSGFYYPLFLSGQGKLKASGEIIRLIIRDESIHGVFVGLLAQNIYDTFSTDEMIRADREAATLFDELYEIEVKYIEEIYSEIGLVEDVKKFTRYNGNKALMNLGKDPAFGEEDVNPIVLAGLDISSTNHDFFSVKGDSYVKTTNVTEITDKDFNFDDVPEV